MSILDLAGLVIFIVLGSWVFWKIFMKIVHVIIFIIVVLILFYIYTKVPQVHSIISNIIH